MKKINHLILGFTFLSFLSCSKEIRFDQNPSIYHHKILFFNSLTVVNPFILPKTKTTIKAVASGENITYKWSTNRGTIEGTGAEIQFSDSVQQKDTIFCEVKDNNGNTLNRNVLVEVTNTLIFSNLSATDTLMPLNFTDTITATASGEDITYSWTASEGNITGSGTKVTFTPPQKVGTDTITCTVTDKNNRFFTKYIILTTTNDIIFKSLKASPDSIVPNQLSTITAIAYGQNLEYKWSSDIPTVTLLTTGFGYSIIATLCHYQTFVITCKVTDANNVEKIKTVSVKMADI